MLVGAAVGFVVGRWWALVVPVAFGIFIAAFFDVDANSTVIGALAALTTGAGVVGGVLLRRLGRRAISS